MSGSSMQMLLGAVGVALLACLGVSNTPNALILVLAIVFGGVLWEYLRNHIKTDERKPLKAVDGISYFSNDYKICYCTDVEGHWQYFVNFVQQCQGLRFVNEKKIDMHQAKLEDVELQLLDGWMFVFGGDSCDKGPGSIRFLTCITKAKAKYPDRIILIYGNRDINKMRWTSELHADIMSLDRLKSLPAGYWADKKSQETTPLIYIRNKAAEGENVSEDKVTDAMLEKYNTKVNRLQYFLKYDMGSLGEFEFRKDELEFLEGRPVSDDEVMKSYEDSLKWNHDKGFMCKYLEQAQLGALINGTLFVHGQIISSQFPNYGPDTWAVGSVPRKAGFITDVKEWLVELNGWARREVNAWKTQPTFSKFPTKPTIEEWKHRGGADLINYGNPMTEFPSVVYCRYLDDKSMPIQYPQRLVEHLVLNGVHRVVVGHTPHGNAPTVVQHLGLTLVMGDTSFSDAGSNTAYKGDNRGDAVASIEIDNHSHFIHVTGRLQKAKGETAPGRVLDYNVLPLGQVLKDNEVELDAFVGRHDGKIALDTQGEDSSFFVKARLPAMPGADSELQYLMCKIDGFKQEYREISLEEVMGYTSANNGSVKLARSRSATAVFGRDELMRDDDEFLEYLFDVIDRDNDGKVQRHELVQSCSNKDVRGMLRLQFPGKEVDSIFATMDADGDGEVTREEFIKCLKGT